MKKIITILLCVNAYFKCHTQSCDQPAGLISVYYNYSINHGYGAGIEAGIVDEHFPLGLLLGCNFIKSKHKNIDEVADNAKNDFANFYLKATVRILRVENKLSVFVVAAPQLSLYSQFNFHTGIKLILPFSERFAFQFEPLYSIKPKSYLFNLHLSFII